MWCYFQILYHALASIIIWANNLAFTVKSLSTGYLFCSQTLSLITYKFLDASKTSANHSLSNLGTTSYYYYNIGSIYYKPNFRYTLGCNNFPSNLKLSARFLANNCKIRIDCLTQRQILLFFHISTACHIQISIKIF